MNSRLLNPRLVSDDVEEFILIAVGSLLCAIPILAVVECFENYKVSKLPGQPAYVEGFIQSRGQNVFLVDLAKKFGMFEEVDRFTHPVAVVVAVVVAVNGRTFALRTNALPETLKVPSSEIILQPQIPTSFREGSIVGAYTQKSGETPRTIFLVDLEVLLSS